MARSVLTMLATRGRSRSAWFTASSLAGSISRNAPEIAWPPPASRFAASRSMYAPIPMYCVVTPTTGTLRVHWRPSSTSTVRRSPGAAWRIRRGLRPG
jgi:hypothetical protein